MGNVGGGFFANGFRLYFNPDVTPDPLKEPTHDPQLGFPNGRKERVMIATKEEMMSAKMPLEDRDYCAHMLLKYKGCSADVWPFPVFCEHEKHAYLNCRYEDAIIRMKEYERERRLMVREKEMKAQEAA